MGLLVFLMSRVVFRATLTRMTTEAILMAGGMMGCLGLRAKQSRALRKN